MEKSENGLKDDIEIGLIITLNINSLVGYFSDRECYNIMSVKVDGVYGLDLTKEEKLIKKNVLSYKFKFLDASLPGGVTVESELNNTHNILWKNKSTYIYRGVQETQYLQNLLFVDTFFLNGYLLCFSETKKPKGNKGDSEDKGEKNKENQPILQKHLCGKVQVNLRDLLLNKVHNAKCSIEIIKDADDNDTKESDAYKSAYLLLTIKFYKSLEFSRKVDIPLYIKPQKPKELIEKQNKGIAHMFNRSVINGIELINREISKLKKEEQLQIYQQSREYYTFLENLKKNPDYFKLYNDIKNVMIKLTHEIITKNIYTNFNSNTCLYEEEEKEEKQEKEKDDKKEKKNEQRKEVETEKVKEIEKVYKVEQLEKEIKENPFSNVNLDCVLSSLFNYVHESSNTIINNYFENENLNTKAIEEIKNDNYIWNFENYLYNIIKENEYLLKEKKNEPICEALLLLIFKKINKNLKKTKIEELIKVNQSNNHIISIIECYRGIRTKHVTENDISKDTKKYKAEYIYKKNIQKKKESKTANIKYLIHTICNKNKKNYNSYLFEYVEQFEHPFLNKQQIKKNRERVQVLKEEQKESTDTQDTTHEENKKNKEICNDNGVTEKQKGETQGKLKEEDKEEEEEKGEEEEEEGEEEEEESEEEEEEESEEEEEESEEEEKEEEEKQLLCENDSNLEEQAMTVFNWTKNKKNKNIFVKVLYKYCNILLIKNNQKNRKKIVDEESFIYASKTEENKRELYQMQPEAADNHKQESNYVKKYYEDYYSHYNGYDDYDKYIEWDKIDLCILVLCTYVEMKNYENEQAIFFLSLLYLNAHKYEKALNLINILIDLLQTSQKNVYKQKEKDELDMERLYMYNIFKNWNQQKLDINEDICIYVKALCFFFQRNYLQYYMNMSILLNKTTNKLSEIIQHNSTVFQEEVNRYKKKGTGNTSTTVSNSKLEERKKKTTIVLNEENEQMEKGSDENVKEKEKNELNEKEKDKGDIQKLSDDIYNSKLSTNDINENGATDTNVSSTKTPNQQSAVDKKKEKRKMRNTEEKEEQKEQTETQNYEDILKLTTINFTEIPPKDKFLLLLIINCLKLNILNIVMYIIENEQFFFTNVTLQTSLYKYVVIKAFFGIKAYSRCIQLIEEYEGCLANLDIVYIYADCLYKQKKYDLSIEQFNTYLSVCKYTDICASIYLKLCKMYAYKKKYEESKKAVKQSMQLYKSSYSFLYLGFYYLKKKIYVTCYKLLHKSNEMSLFNHKLWAYLTSVFLHLNMKKQADGSFSNFLKMKKYDERTLEELISSYKKYGYEKEVLQLQCLTKSQEK